MKKQKSRRYSVAFKRQVVSEYEQGTSESKLKQKYGINGSTTIKKWVGQYGREGYRHEVVYIQTMDDMENVKAMKVKIQSLETALAEAVLDRRMLLATLEIASQELGIDLKKSFGTT